MMYARTMMMTTDEHATMATTFVLAASMSSDPMLSWFFAADDGNSFADTKGVWPTDSPLRQLVGCRLILRQLICCGFDCRLILRQLVCRHLTRCLQLASGL